MVTLTDKELKQLLESNKNQSKSNELQVFWFKLCTTLLVIIGGLLTYDYIQEKITNKEQTLQISKNKEDIAIIKSKDTEASKWREQVDDKFERVIFKE